MRKEIRSFSEQLSDPSPAARAQAAEQLAQHAGNLLPSERPILLIELRDMACAGNECSDFIFGLHAIGLIGSEQMPAFTNEGLPLRKSDAARIIFELCSLDWVSAKFSRDEILRAGIKALRPIAGSEPRTSILGTLLASLSSEKRMERMLGLAAIFSFELGGPETLKKTAFATLDWDSEVRFQAEQAYRALSKFNHPLREVALCTAQEAYSSAIKFIGKKGIGREELDAFKEFSTIAFLRRIGKGDIFTDLLVERSLLSGQEVDRYAECALIHCPSEERKERVEKRRIELKGKIRQIRREQEILSRPEGTPHISCSKFCSKKPEKGSKGPQTKMERGRMHGMDVHGKKSAPPRVSRPWSRLPITIKA